VYCAEDFLDSEDFSSESDPLGEDSAAEDCSGEDRLEQDGAARQVGPTYTAPPRGLPRVRLRRWSRVTAVAVLATAVSALVVHALRSGLGGGPGSSTPQATATRVMPLARHPSEADGGDHPAHIDRPAASGNGPLRRGEGPPRRVDGLPWRKRVAGGPRLGLVRATSPQRGTQPSPAGSVSVSVTFGSAASGPQPVSSEFGFER
jgi:hypothetical protein